MKVTAKERKESLLDRIQESAFEGSKLQPYERKILLRATLVQLALIEHLVWAAAQRVEVTK